MSKQPYDGGPAFPHPALADEDFSPSYDMSGMSLRDWFAGQAIAAIIRVTSDGKHNVVTAPGDSFEVAMAKDAYCIADAMLAARAPQAEGVK